MSAESARGWLAGIIDGEGCIYHNRANNTRELRIVNTDPNILDTCERVLSDLDVRCAVYPLAPNKLGKKNLYQLVTVGGYKSLDRIYRQVPLQSRKKDQLKALLDSYTYNKKERETI